MRLTRLIVAGFLGAITMPSFAAEVNVYSARQDALIAPLLEQFEEATGIEVNLITGKAEELLTRIKAEGAATPADLLITVDAGNLHRAKEAGVLRSIDSTLLYSRVPSQWIDPDKQWIGLTVRARPIFYAKDRVDPSRLSTYEALTDAQWKGRVCIRSSGNIYNQSLVASMIEANVRQQQKSGRAVWSQISRANRPVGIPTNCVRWQRGSVTLQLLIRITSADCWIQTSQRTRV